MPKGKKPARSHKSRAERAKLAKVSDVRIIGGFQQRTAKPAVTGDKVKSRMVRVDHGFATFLRDAAIRYGGITEVTRRLNAKAPLLIAILDTKEST